MLKVEDSKWELSLAELFETEWNQARIRIRKVEFEKQTKRDISSRLSSAQLSISISISISRSLYRSETRQVFPQRLAAKRKEEEDDFLAFVDHQTESQIERPQNQSRLFWLLLQQNNNKTRGGRRNREKSSPSHTCVLVCVLYLVLTVWSSFSLRRLVRLGVKMNKNRDETRQGEQRNSREKGRKWALSHSCRPVFNMIAGLV